MRLVSWAGAALCVGGCAGAGSTTLGPTPASSVAPVSSPQSASAASPAPAVKPKAARSLAAVHSWTLAPPLPEGKSETLLAALTSGPVDLLIVDTATLAPLPAPKATPTTPPVKPLAVLQQKGRRRVLALLDIGEIAEADPAWQAAWVDASTGKSAAKAPAWLDAPDAKAPGVHPVHFWDADWQKRTTAALDRLVDAGYDGVCLQGIGLYESRLKSHPTAATDMAAFVEALAARARDHNANFAVMTDGGTALPDALKDTAKTNYLAALDGVLARDVFYPGDRPADNDLAPDADVLAALDTFQKAGLPVFVTERLTDPDKIADFWARAKSKDYRPDAAFSEAAPPPPPTAGTQMAATLL